MFTSYDDYLKWFNSQRWQGYDEAPKPMEEWRWNDPEANKWDLLGGMYELSPGQPGYEQAMAALKGQNKDGDFRTITISQTPGGKDKGRTVKLPDGSYAWSVDNSDQSMFDDEWKLIAAGVGSVLGAGFLGNAFGLGAEGGAGSYNFLGNMIDPAIVGSGSAADALPAMSGVPSFGGGGAYNFLGNMIDPSMVGAGSAADGLPAMAANPFDKPWYQRLLGPLADPSKLPEWIAANPGPALRLGLGAASLLGAGVGGGNNSGGGSGGGGNVPWSGPIPTFNPQITPFVQNPYLNYQVPFMGGF